MNFSTLKLCLLLVLAIKSSTAQHRIQNLVFEGAGIRGIAYCGAIRELENKNMLQQVERVGGTSAGAITALTLSLGYTADEIASIIADTDFKKFNDGRYMFAGGINRLRKYFGWYRGQQFSAWLEGLITAKTANANITFEQLYRQGFKDLYVTATCLNRQQLVILSRHTYPSMRVKDAVRISMSIPFYFEAVFVDSAGNVVTRPRKKTDLDVMVDGGLTGNFPIHMFDSSGIANMATIGFRIDRDEQIASDRDTRSLAAMPVNNIKEYGNAFYNMVIENLNRQSLSAADWQRTISISDGKIGPKIRRLSKTEIDTLVSNGRTATSNYFKQ